MSPVPSQNEIKSFLDEITHVCEKYGISIGHEDGHGNFILEKFSRYNIDWLANAAISSELKEGEKV